MGYYNGFDGFSLMSSLFPIFFITIFCIIIGMIIYSIVQYAQDKNNHSNRTSEGCGKTNQR